MTIHWNWGYPIFRQIQTWSVAVDVFDLFWYWFKKTWVLQVGKKSSWFDLVISVLTRCGRMGLVFGESWGAFRVPMPKRVQHLCCCCCCQLLFLLLLLLLLFDMCFCFIICYDYRNKKVKRVWGEHWGTTAPGSVVSTGKDDQFFSHWLADKRTVLPPSLFTSNRLHRMLSGILLYI